jgi:histidinol-phosphatase (PHP family)
MRVSLVDYHVHESYSSDARDSKIECYVEMAEKMGVQEIAFTTHQIIVGQYSNFGVQKDEISDYVSKIRSLDENTDVRLLAGLEVDYFEEAEREIESLINEYSFDFILGSTHFIGNYDIGSIRDTPSFFNERSIGEATGEYFNIWRKAIESGLFDSMAHPDYWRRFIHLCRENSVSFTDYNGVYEAIDSLISYNTAVEVNSSGKRHEHRVQYPIREFLEAAHGAGLKKITLGSDSHIPTHLGYMLPEMVDLIQEIGFKHISCYRNRKCSFKTIDSIIRNVNN